MSLAKCRNPHFAKCSWCCFVIASLTRKLQQMFNAGCDNGGRAAEAGQKARGKLTREMRANHSRMFAKKSPVLFKTLKLWWKCFPATSRKNIRSLLAGLGV